MNTFDIVYNELNKDGMSVEVMRKRKDGVMQKADMREMSTLGTKSRVASTAGLLRNLSSEEKLDWALETKREANELYAEKKYAEAMEKYVECLAGADFGSKSNGSNDSCQESELDNDDANGCHSVSNTSTTEAAEATVGGNVDALVIPVLCNLAACCIQQEEWYKAASFAEQALLLRPQCCKALFRKGLSLLQIGEFDESLSLFRSVQHQLETTSLNMHSVELSTKDIERLPKLIIRARQGAKQQKMHRLKQKASLQDAFKRNSQQQQQHHNDATTSVSQQLDEYKDEHRADSYESIKPMSLKEFLLFLLHAIIRFLTNTFSKNNKIS